MQKNKVWTYGILSEANTSCGYKDSYDCLFYAFILKAGGGLPMSVTKIGIFTTVLLSIASALQADSFTVVFGSFVNKENAQNRKAELENILGESVSISPVEIDGTEYLRTSVRLGKRSAAQRLLERSIKLDISGAWVLESRFNSLASGDGVMSQPADNHSSVADEPEKIKALETAIGQIEKTFGKGSVMKLGQNDSVVDIGATVLASSLVPFPPSDQ